MRGEFSPGATSASRQQPVQAKCLQFRTIASSPGFPGRSQITTTAASSGLVWQGHAMSLIVLVPFWLSSWLSLLFMLRRWLWLRPFLGGCGPFSMARGQDRGRWPGNIVRGQGQCRWPMAIAKGAMVSDHGQWPLPRPWPLAVATALAKAMAIGHGQWQRSWPVAIGRGQCGP